MHPVGDYCAYEKAVEHLGDRWMLLICRELAMHPTRGFNALADGLPGISRSVLARRLRKLEDLGLITRERSARPRLAPYTLTPAGEHLRPVLTGLNAWAERFVPEDSEILQHDPEMLAFWLMRRVDTSSLPDASTVLVFQVGGASAQQQWLVLERGTPPSLCIEDPLLSNDRYVYLEAEANALYPLSRGLVGWPDAIRDGSVVLYGEPKLLREVPRWFQPVDAETRAAVVA